MKNVIWEPTPPYRDESNIRRFMDQHGIRDYQELITRASRDYEWFWDAAVKDLNIEWFRPYDRLVDTSAGIAWSKWFLGGRLNIAHNCLDRHAASPLRDKTALIWESETGEVQELTYTNLHRGVNQVANLLKELGIGKGDTVGMYMPMVPEMVMAFYACFKIGAICIPIFSGFSAAAVAARLNDAGARVLFTADGSVRRGKEVEIKKEADAAVEVVPSIEKVVVLRRLGIDVPWRQEKDIWFHEAVARQDPGCGTEQLEAEDYCLVIYTSGTTGKPKGTVHTHGGCMAQMAKEVRYYFDVRQDDVFFWVTDIGWMMGPWELIGVMNFGGTVVIYEGAPNHPHPGRLWQVVEQQRVTILGVSPTVIRLLMRSGEEWVKKHNLEQLRILGSTGEPWDEESYMWFFEKVGGRRCPIINISGGTELVGCLLSPLPINSLKSCTLRGPGLGMDVDVYDDDGQPVRGGIGHLVWKNPAPSMTRGLWRDPERYLETYWSKWPGVWYHGDWAMVDEDGFWFLFGRADDTMKIAGRRTGPGEIESALIQHPAVSEAAAIGVPDELKGEAVVCFVVLHPAFEPSEELREELKEQVVTVMGKALRPKEVRFVRELPKTRSAKIVRRAIKATFLGKEDVGDLSTVENPQALDEIARAL